MAQQKGGAVPGFKREVSAILGIFFSFFLFFSLFSGDISSTGNWCGEIGSFISQVVSGFTGFGAYILVLLLLFFSLMFFSPSMQFERLPQVTAGVSGTVIACCSLFSAASLYQQEYIEWGGFLGTIVFTLFHSVFGAYGTILVLVFLLLVSLMLALHFSPYRLALLFGGMLKSCMRGLKHLFARLIAGSLIAESGAKESVELRPVKARKRRKVEDGVVEDGQRGHSKVESAVLADSSAEESAVLRRPVVKELPKDVEAQDDGSLRATPLARGDWKIPPLSLLNKNEQVQKEVDKEVYYAVSKQLEQQLENFGVSGKVVGISPGPVVTTYEYAPAPGVKINKIAGLANDLALGLKAQSVRVVGSIPGKAALGIEIPNVDRQVVYIRELLAADAFLQNKSKLTVALGLDVVGNVTVADLSKMPHLLIAGATGAGKSVAINTIIASMLFNATPEEVRFLMIDPKRIELSGYEGIPHLLHPVVVEPKLASRALQWAVREMERRYRALEEAKVKSFSSFNEVAEEKMPYIVIVVDELADLMMVASKDVESSIARLAQMARAAGMHLILATQRPSVDVLTGLIKANFPTRISFKVSSKIDSRTIIDTSGAEHLLGMGDMLYLPPGTSALRRIHGAFISEGETARLVEFWKEQGTASYDESVVAEVEDEGDDSVGGEDDYDERYDEAVAIVCEAGGASISMIQRRLRIGYNRAARMIEKMEKDGIVGPADGSKPREVLVRGEYS